MKYYGDISEAHLDLVEELQALEKWFDDFGSKISRVSAAKGMTAIAADYIDMEMDEEAHRLLYRAEALHSGYFKTKIHTQMEQDMEFEDLVFDIYEHPVGFKSLQELGFVE